MKTFLSTAILLGLLGLPLRVTGAPLETNLVASCFDVTRDGTNRVHLLYGAPREDGVIELFHRIADGAGRDWSAPVSVPTGHALPGSHHRGNDPQLAVAGNRVLAVWNGKGGGPFGSGEIGTALSDDGGKTWRAGPTPLATGETDDKTGYRFPAVTAGPDGFHLIWIHAREKERSLRHVRLGYDSKAWTAPNTIDTNCCACCWNQLKVDSTGKLWVLYRDEEPKDLSLASSIDGGKTWLTSGSVGKFNWKFVGCPHVGGGLSLPAIPKDTAPLLVASVWTGHTAAGAAYVLTSHDGGKTWPEQAGLTSDGAAGRHTDTATLSLKHAAAVWDQATTNGISVHFRLTADAGKSWTEPHRLSQSTRNASYPRLIAGNGEYLAFWTETANPKKPTLRTETIPCTSGAY